MGRASFHDYIFGETNRGLLTGRTIHLYDVGTSTPISDTIFSDYTSGATLANGWTSSDGEILFYLAASRVLDVVTKLAGVEKERRTVPVLAEFDAVAGSVLFADSNGNISEDNADLFWDDTNNMLIVGPRGNYAPITGTIHTVTGASDDVRGIIVYQNDGTSSNGGRIISRKARGTPSAPAVVVANDALGDHAFEGYDGTNFLRMAVIQAVVEGTVASTRIPTRLAFFTGTDATPSVRTEAMRITSAQELLIGTTTTFAAGARLQVRGAASAKAAIFRANATSPGNIIEAQDSAGTPQFTVSAVGALNAVTSYAVAGTKVLGERGAAVADATDAASAITQLNALLARVRANTGHGLIA